MTLPATPRERAEQGPHTVRRLTLPRPQALAVGLGRQTLALVRMDAAAAWAFDAPNTWTTSVAVPIPLRWATLEGRHRPFDPGQILDIRERRGPAPRAFARVATVRAVRLGDLVRSDYAAMGYVIDPTGDAVLADHRVRFAHHWRERYACGEFDNGALAWALGLELTDATGDPVACTERPLFGTLAELLAAAHRASAPKSATPAAERVPTRPGNPAGAEDWVPAEGPSNRRRAVELVPLAVGLLVGRLAGDIPADVWQGRRAPADRERRALVSEARALGIIR